LASAPFVTGGVVDATLTRCAVAGEAVLMAAGWFAGTAVGVGEALAGGALAQPAAIAAAITAAKVVLIEFTVDSPSVVVVSHGPPCDRASVPFSS